MIVTTTSLVFVVDLPSLFALRGELHRVVQHLLFSLPLALRLRLFLRIRVSIFVFIFGSYNKP